jgi:hypothetical protein
MGNEGLFSNPRIVSMAREKEEMQKERGKEASFVFSREHARTKNA